MAEEIKSWIDIAYNSIIHPINYQTLNRNAEWELPLNLITALKIQNMTSEISVQRVNFALQPLLEKAVVNDPTILKGNDVSFGLLDQKTKFKIDTGAKVSTLDADDIQWDKPDNFEKVLEAYKLNEDTFSERSTLLKEHLKDLPEEYQNLDFGKVSSFNLVLDKDGKEKKMVTKDFPVNGISWPRPSTGEKSVDPRPFIAISVESNEHLISDLDVALVRRKNMSRRGLFGLYDLKKYGLSIVVDDRDISVVDFSKVDPKVLVQTLQPGA